MNATHLALFVAAMFTLLPTWAGAEEAAARGRQSAETFDLPSGKQIKFWLYLPQGYEENEKWPLMLFLHGAGERGEDLELVKKHGPPKLIEQGKDFPLIVISPQCPRDTRWVAEDVAALVNHIMEIHNVDRQRFYITGLSMGGRGTWSVAGAMADQVAAIAPICGPANREVASKIARIPTWVFHGGKDTVVELSHSEEMVNLLKQHGGQPKFTIYPEANHDSWTETYDNQELYDWLLSHKK